MKLAGLKYPHLPTSNEVHSANTKTEFQLRNNYLGNHR